MTKLFTSFDLQLFGEGGSSGESGTGDTGVSSADAAQIKGGKSLDNVVYGIGDNDGQDAADDNPTEGSPTGKESETPVDVNTQIDKKAEFEKLIKGDYKDVFDKRVQQIINGRFKETAELKEQFAKINPVLDMLSQKYGIQPNEVEKLSKAILEDSAFYEEEAAARGITVEQLKQEKKMQREMAELKRASDEVERQKAAQQQFAKWTQQAAAAKQIYPDFDLRAESENGDFVGLLKAGVDVRTAYEVIHKDDIIGGAMQYAAKAATSKMADGLKTKQSRPAENGSNSNSNGMIMRKDVNSLTKADFKEIEKRVMRGEKIAF